MTRWLCLKAFFANVRTQCRLRRFFIHSLVSQISDMRGSHLQKLY